MTKFLSDEDLGPAIREVVGGSDLRCAVAFWGKGAARTLFEEGIVPRDARIVCDISMGGTNPLELEAMGAPDNENLAQLHGLHAKVYISDKGLIVASANASNNGIGFLDVAGLIEAGTFHEVNSGLYQQASGWFDDIWDRASTIDQSTLDLAGEAWRRRKVQARDRTSRPANPNSLLDQVASDPESFRGVGFVFTSGSSTAAHRAEAVDALIDEDDGLDAQLLSKQARRALGLWPLGNVFSDWSAEDISAWPKRFVCAHEGSRGSISYWFYERSHAVLVDEDRGMVLATQVRNLRRDLGFRHGRKTMAEVDRDRLETIFEHVQESGHRLFENGKSLASFLSDMGPGR